MNQHRGEGQQGEFHSQVQELRKFPDQFYQYFQMSTEKFDELLLMVKRQIEKENINWQSAISAEERLAVCLRSVDLLCCSINYASNCCHM